MENSTESEPCRDVEVVDFYEGFVLRLDGAQLFESHVQV